jgi:hypothetical protein
VSLVRTDVSEERISFIKVTRIGELVTADIPSSPNLVTLMMEAIHSSETSILTRATWRTIPEDGVFHSHCREQLQILQSINLLDSVAEK